MNPRPLGYEPNELPDCSTPRQNQTQTTKTSPTEKFKIFKIQNRKSKSKICLVGLGRVELPTSQPTELQAHVLICRRVFAAKKSHTSLQCGSVFTVDAPEGRVASVAINYCLRSTSLLSCKRAKLATLHFEI